MFIKSATRSAFYALVGVGVLCLGSSLATAKTIPVVASFSVLADVVKNVGGDHVSVKSLVPPGGDPHDYEPTPRDSQALKDSAVTFFSGEGMETWFERLVQASGTSQKSVFVSQGIPTRSMVEDGETIIDPHVWNNVANVKIWVKNIEQALVKANPEEADDIHASAQRYTNTLSALDATIRKRMNALPKAHRTVLTSHDAFGYYAEAYGVKFISPVGFSTESEASAKDVAAVIDQIKAEKIGTYFLENSNSGRLVEQIAKATGAQPGGELYPEALSDGPPCATYIDMLTHNTDLIEAAIIKAAAQ